MSIAVVLLKPVASKTDTSLYIVTVSGNGRNFAGSKTVTFRLLDSRYNIAKAELKSKIDDQEYTGRNVTLNRKDLKEKLYTGKKSAPSYLSWNNAPDKDDFEVLSYTGNLRKGNAKVTLKGINTYAGTKTVKFRITAKKAPFKGVISDGKWRK